MKKKGAQWAWDLWCIGSIIGIWPRFIEPKLLSLTKVFCKIPSLPTELIGFKLLHFSDLHWNEEFSSSMADKLIQKVKRCNPDVIVFTGDFLCRAKLKNQEALKAFLQTFKAPYGCFAVLGNHDYSHFVTVNHEGDYDIDDPSPSSEITKGFKRLFNASSLSGKVTERAKNLDLNSDLIALLKQTPFRLLNNQTLQIAYKGSKINISGLEEYSTARFNPELAFVNYDKHYPGIVLSHNPDTLPVLQHYPGDILLSGHTHGGQVNIPGLWKRFTRIEYVEFKRGLKRIGNKWAYINRGISSVMKFRWFSLPELTLITLKRG